MTARQRAWPRQWLMTDERLGDGLWAAIDRLPHGESGIVFRHYATPAGERQRLALRVARLCRRRRIVLAIAGDAELAERLGADLVHKPTTAPSLLPFSLSVHSFDQAVAASRHGAALVFVSPVNATRSHPGRLPLGALGAANLARAAGVPAIALGGMDRASFEALPQGAFHGWAAIDAWLSGERA